MIYITLKYLHIVSATLILGTGIGIAFFLLMAHRSRDVTVVARTADIVVKADMIFTATAMLSQPVTGFFLAREEGIPLSEFWILASLVLYCTALVFWLPVLWLQARMRDLAMHAESTGMQLPPDYGRLFRVWFFLGFPGAGAILLIIWLMIARPSF